MSTSSSDLEVMAPLSGLRRALETVPDPVFAGKVVGPGIAIDPTSQMLLSPIDGEVTQVHRAHHAITIQSAGGTQILLHIGIDTVKLNGEGFTAKVKTGDHVTRGQALIEFDADLIAARAPSLLTLMIATDVGEEKLKFKDVASFRAGQDVAFTIKGASLPKSSAPVSLAREAESAEITITLPTGLHARPAALLASLAKSYRSDVQLLKGEVAGNAKSVVAIMGLEILNADRVRFKARGVDASAAVERLAHFLSELEEKPSEPAPAAASSTPRRPKSLDPAIVAGVGVSPGVAIGRVHQIRTLKLEIPERSAGTAPVRRAHLTRALALAASNLRELGAQVKLKTDASQAAIFAAHQELLEDPDILDDANLAIEKGFSAPFAWNKSINAHAERLANLNNEMMANRANDLRDVGRRVLLILLGKAGGDQAPLADGAILIAENLTPSETVQIDRTKVYGFCTTTGGATSHVAILARSLGLPAIAGLEGRGLEIPEGTEVILDGDHGALRLNPNAADKAKAEARQKDQEQKREAALSESNKPALTRDGRRIEVAANIGSVADARQAVAMGADGVGLLRSEFLFLERESAPSEEEQFRVYQEIADVLEDRTLVIRTLDVGGDKPLKYLPIETEENPFLGIRGIRVGFLHPEVLREQLRAILRVQHRGKLCVMFPMIASIDEFRRAKEMLEEERALLKAKPVEIGIMVEVPSVALTAEIFAREVDFFSVGTNDLTQYTLAMDRGHTGLAKQVDALHPSVLRLIGLSAEAAHRHGKWIGVCGGLASDLKAVPILLGLGIDELSVSIPTVPLVKSTVRETAINDAATLAARAVAAANAAGVREL